MIFTIKSYYTESIEFTRAQIMLNARRTILGYKMCSNELLIEQYLKENYSTTLKNACLNILNNIHCNHNGNEELVITILDKKLDKLAQLITYGNSQINGSKILTVAFDREERS